jgi:hypothetical protein
MKQKVFLYVEEGVGIYDDLDHAMKVKQDLNDVGIKARLRIKTPNFLLLEKGKKRKWVQGVRSHIVIKPSKPAR